jgi:xylose isomerase
MNDEKSLHAVCRWTFHAGRGGFVPANMRPQWNFKNLDTPGVIKLIRNKIAPRLPEDVELGIEIRFESEVDEKTAPAIADALVDSGIYLAMLSLGAHVHWGYGGIASLDPKERKDAEEFYKRGVDLIYEFLRKTWHPDPEKAPSFVLWNGSWGYDMASVGIKAMYQNLKESVAGLCHYEADKGGNLYIGIEPKPNEGHPAMLIPTVASALRFWRKLEEEFGVSRDKKGVNKEFGHSEMIGLDPVYDTVEEIDDHAIIHMHLNSQGYNDGIILGGPGKYDIDHGVRINGMNIAIAGLIDHAGYHRWKGHDMQVRPYDNVEQGVDRIVRSILSWEACAKVARALDTVPLMKYLESRETAKAEDLMREAVIKAQQLFKQMYK